MYSEQVGYVIGMDPQGWWVGPEYYEKRESL